MKFFFLTITFGFVAIILSCDKITDPKQIKNTVITPVIVDSSSGEVLAQSQKVLIVDFTGFKCGNCPEAHTEGERLKTKYGKNLVVVAVHATNTFAAPNSGGTKYRKDYRTIAGNTYDLDYQLDIRGLPNGWTNTFGNSNFNLYKNWETAVDSLVAKPAKINLTINNLTISNNVISANLEVYSNNDIDDSLNYIVMITEDSIIDWQKDYRLASGLQDVVSYQHMHVLRDVLNDSYGVAIANNAFINKKQKYTYAISYDASSKTTWNKTKLNVVAFVYNRGSGKIYNVIEKPIAN